MGSIYFLFCRMPACKLGHYALPTINGKKKNKMVTVGKVNAKTVLMLEVTCDWPNTAI